MLLDYKLLVLIRMVDNCLRQSKIFDMNLIKFSESILEKKRVLVCHLR